MQPVEHEFHDLLGGKRLDVDVADGRHGRRIHAIGSTERIALFI